MIHLMIDANKEIIFFYRKKVYIFITEYMVQYISEIIILALHHTPSKRNKEL